MFPSPILLGAAFSGLLGTGLAAPAEPEQCLTGSYVVFEVQPYEVVCGGATSTSTVTKYVMYLTSGWLSKGLTRISGPIHFPLILRPLMTTRLVSQDPLETRILLDLLRPLGLLLSPSPVAERTALLGPIPQSRDAPNVLSLLLPGPPLLSLP